MKPINITNEGDALTNCLLKLEIDKDNDMQSDYADIRFKHENNPGTWLDYWIEDDTEDPATVWVEVATLPASGSTLYLFYGNSGASSASDITIFQSWQKQWSSDLRLTNHWIWEGAWDPDVEYGGEYDYGSGLEDLFLVSWEEGSTIPIKQEIRGRICTRSGSVVDDYQGNQATWHSENPSIAFDGTNFLVTWKDHSEMSTPNAWDIKGAFVGVTGSVYNTFQICTQTNLQRDPCVAFNTNDDQYFVTWEDHRDGNDWDIYAKRYTTSTSGSQTGSEIAVCSDSSNDQFEPWVAYNDVDNEYMVVYEESPDENNGPFSLYFGIFSATGGTVVSKTQIVSGSSVDNLFPCVAFCSETQQYLVTWNEADMPSEFYGDIKGKIYDENGVVVKNTFTIDSGDFIRTDIVPYGGNTFLIAYSEIDSVSNSEIWGKLISSDGTILTPTTIQLSDGDTNPADWVNLAVDDDGGIFATWEDGRHNTVSKPDAYGNIWWLTIAGSDVTYSVGSEKEMILTAHVTSIKIEPENLASWDEFTEVSSRGNDIVFDILDGNTGVMILHDISNGYDISGITATSIRLKATFSRTNPSSSPAIDMWGVSYYTNSPPNAPSNPSPPNGATNVALDADLSWTGGDPDPGDTVTYDVYFSTSSPPPKVIANQSATTYNPGALNFGTIYYWKIVAWDDHGATAAGPIWSFTTKYNNPPNTPSSPSPPNGAVNVNLNADLSWSGGDPDPGDTVTYDVYFGTSSLPPKIITNQSGTTYDPGTLNYNTTYYWKIVAWDNHGATTAGPIWSFTSRTNHPPNTPSNPSPANGAVNVNLDEDLSWTGGDPDPGDTVTYDIYFGTTNPPPIKTYGHTTTTYDPGTMDYGTTYYWKIVAWDSFGESAAGPIWSFTTEANSPPYTPSNPDPSNGATNVELDATLSWTGGDPNGDPVTYDVYFGTSSSPPKVAANQSDTNYNPGALNFGTTYYWKIVAWDNYGFSSAGPIWSFTTEYNNPPNTPSNPSPANGAVNIPLNVDLSWVGGDPDGDDVYYDVYFGTSSPPPKVIANQSETTYDPGLLEFSTTYYWKIVAWDEYGATATGLIWNFATGTNSAPNTPSNPHPGNGEANVPIATDLSWTGGDPDGDPVTYDVYFGTETPLPKVSANQSGENYLPGTLNYNTTYYWQIVAWDDHDASASGPIWEFKTLESFNQPPNTPSIWGDGSFIPGVEFIQPNVEYTFTVVASDSDGDDVYYWIDWGDNTNSDWLGPYPTSEHITASHTWTETLSIMVIKVKAKDVHGAESGWGQLIIIIIKNSNVVINNRIVMNNMQTLPQSQVVINQVSQSSSSGIISGQSMTTPLATTRSTTNI